MPISAADITSFSEVLNLADPQRVFFERLHNEYATKAQQLFDESLPNLNRLSVEGGRAMYPTITLESADLGSQLAEGEFELAKKLGELESSMFVQLEAVLAEPQLIALPRVKAQRARQRVILIDCPTLGARIDLVAFLQRFDLEQESKDAIRPWLEQYDAQATPLVTELDEKMRFNRVRGRFLDAEIAAILQSAQPDLARLQAIKDEYHKILPAQARLQRKIVELNEQILQALLPALPDEQSKVIEDTYHRSAYRDVYPDSLDPRKLFKQIIALSTLDDDQRGALLPLGVDYDQRLRAIEHAMVKRQNEWNEQFAETFTGAGHDEYREAMRKLRDQRWELDQNLIDQCRSLLPETTLAPLADEIKGFLRLVAATRQVAETDDYPRP